MSFDAITLQHLATALQKARGQKTQAKKYLLQQAAADHALLLALAQPFLDSIVAYALDFYARKHPEMVTSASATKAGDAAVSAPISAKQKAAIELLAAAYKKQKSE